MRLPIIILIGILSLTLSSCVEKPLGEKNHADRALGNTVEKILEEENFDQAIWNPEGINPQNVPTIEVKDEKELRQVIRALKKNADKMNRTIDHINTVNQRRFENFSRQLSKASNRKDSLRVALQFPDITYIRDTSELIELGLLPKH